MANVAVILGADDIFGTALCSHLLQKEWIVFGGTIDAIPSSLEALQANHPSTFGTIPMDPRSKDSIETAAKTIEEQVDHIDLLICNINQIQADPPFPGLDFDALQQTYDSNALGPIRFVSSFLPLADQGLKRLCFLTDTEGSIDLSHAEDKLGYSMSKTALHMMVTILANDLRKDGYTFRLYLLRKEPTISAQFACDYFLANKDDESRLTVTDDNGDEWPV